MSKVWLLFPLCYVLGVCFAYFVFDDNSAWNKKRFDKKVRNIGYVCRILKIEELSVENKGFQFSVRVEDKDDYEGIRYISSPYNTTDIYINDELVCRIHKLENLWVTYRTLEYTKERSMTEVNDIIVKAYKLSKKRENEYYNNKVAKENLNTFYK